jgi:LL-diaminopimelate aminotransferase
LKGERIKLNELWYRRQTTKFNGTSYISQRGAEATYTPAAREQIQQTIGYYMQNAKKMLERLRASGLEVYGGENAPYLWVKTPEGMTSWRFFEQMLYTAQVVCTPGVGFGPSGEGYVRLTAFNSHEQTDEALTRIEHWLSL